MKLNDECYLRCGGYYKHYFDKYGYEILRCSNCSLCVLAFTGNYDKFLVDYYKEGYFEGGAEYFGYKDYVEERSCIVKNFEGYYETISKYVQRGRHLDVGCAAGYFVDLMLAKGFDSYGIDVSEYAVQLAEPQIRPRLKSTALHKYDSEEYGSYDVITLFDLIEHLADPNADLKLVHSLLSKSGYLFIITGDIGSLYAKVMWKYNHFFAVPQHLFFFDRTTIRVLLSKVGFEVEEITSKGKWITFDYLTQIAGLSLPILNLFLRQEIVAKLLRGRSLYFNLGDTMLVTAKKK